MKESVQLTDTILMVRPFRFDFNTETATTNIFQRRNSTNSPDVLHQKASHEFDTLVKKLRDHKIYVVVLQDPGIPTTPDSLFPYNWISFHADQMILYPMLAENRRKERRPGWISLLKDSFHYKNILDFSGHEKQNLFLEGTGSMVLDRKNKVAYANLSSRTNEKMLYDFSSKMNYELICFTANDLEGNEIYHTNVLMAIGEGIAVICSSVIKDESEEKVLEKLSQHFAIAEISYDQMMKFAGNMLLVKNRDEENFWVMSEQAFHSLTSSQIQLLRIDGDFIYSNLETIETIGGGSARCMMAEVFYEEI